MSSRAYFARSVASALHERRRGERTLLAEAMTNTIKTTIDRLEDIEYISEVNNSLEIRYNCPPQINLAP